jgi:VWFA-related protein
MLAPLSLCIAVSEGVLNTHKRVFNNIRTPVSNRGNQLFRISADYNLCARFRIKGDLAMHRAKRVLSVASVITAFFCADLALGQKLPNVAAVPRYHSTVSEVRLVFFATQHNRPVDNLQMDDFAVVDNEWVIRSFRSFSRAALNQLDVVVLFDASESVLRNFKRQIADTMQLIAQGPWNAEDIVSVLSFNGTEIHSICAGDCRTSLTSDRLVSVPTGGATPLFDALEAATSFLNSRRQTDSWPLIILFSDGEDTISRTSFHETLDKILSREIQVYAIDVGNPAQPSTGTAVLHSIAENSGGRYLTLGEGAAKILGEIIDDLHSARVVTYPLPSSESEVHSIRILPTHNLNLEFHIRRGYYFASKDAH